MFKVSLNSPAYKVPILAFLYWESESAPLKFGIQFPHAIPAMQGIADVGFQSSEVSLIILNGWFSFQTLFSTLGRRCRCQLLLSNPRLKHWQQDKLLSSRPAAPSGSLSHMPQHTFTHAHILSLSSLSPTLQKNVPPSIFFCPIDQKKAKSKSMACNYFHFQSQPLLRRTWVIINP